ncbi:hypothetical protein Esti_006055 [Eimeria stiedai]
MTWTDSVFDRLGLRLIWGFTDAGSDRFWSLTLLGFVAGAGSPAFFAPDSPCGHSCGVLAKGPCCGTSWLMPLITFPSDGGAGTLARSDLNECRACYRGLWAGSELKQVRGCQRLWMLSYGDGPLAAEVPVLGGPWTCGGAWALLGVALCYLSFCSGNNPELTSR